MFLNRYLANTTPTVRQKSILSMYDVKHALTSILINTFLVSLNRDITEISGEIEGAGERNIRIKI